MRQGSLIQYLQAGRLREGLKRGFVHLTLFWSGGYQIDTCLPFSLYLLHGFRSESEQPYRNRVNLILVTRLIDQSKPSREHIDTHFDTRPTGIGLNDSNQRH